MEECTVYWNGNALQNETSSEEGSEDADEKPGVSVSKDETGFIYVLARPTGANRTVALTLESNPEPGVYEFRPLHSNFDFSVRLEYDDEPYPDPSMHVLDLTTPLSAVEAGDQIEIGFRKDKTDSPGVTSIRGQVMHVLDFSGLVPDFPAYFRDPTTILSILVSPPDEGSPDDMKMLTPTDSDFITQTRLEPFGDSLGTLDVVGDDYPLNFQWEGKSDTPALQVEFVRINPEQESEQTVENESLPDIQFDRLATYSVTERISILKSAFSNALDRQVTDETLEFFATAVDDPPNDRTITVQYDSSRSENTLTKSGTFTGTCSVYYADENRARHQLRFGDSDGRYYILLDSENPNTNPPTVCSVSPTRHWDTDLGPLIDFELSE
jgi:hypothetical protein